MTDQGLQLLLDRADISQVIHTYATAIDTRNWEMLASCFTEDLEADFRSFAGREVVRGRDNWITAIKRTIEGLDATQHLTGNHTHQIVGKKATLTAYLQAVHRLNMAKSDPEYTVGGYYTCKLKKNADRWHIYSYKLVVSWQRGNREILRQAQKKQ